MRKITQEAVSAFMNAESYRSGNTAVKVLPNVTVMELRGNPIAYRYNDPQNTLSITDAYWPTNTTKERLNGIPGVSISQRKGVWFLNGAEWGGELIDVK